LRRRIRAAALLACAWLLASGRAGRGDAFRIGIVEPAAGRPVFGVVEVVVELRGRERAKVDLYLDERRVGTLEQPPYRFTVDVGQQNVSHTFRAVAVAPDGATDRVELALPAVRVDDVVELPLVQLYVTATRDGVPALDLDREKFRVRDDRREQTLVTFERGDVPITAVLLLDSSLSMRGAPMAAAVAGARAFIEAMAPLDEAKVLMVSDQVIRRTPFGSDPDELLSGVAGAVARGGTAIQDHLYLALRELEARQGRRVVVLLSDGVDVDSLLSTSDLEPVVGRSPALLYWIRLGGSGGGMRHRSVWRTFEEHSAELTGLARLVERTGGRIFDLPRVDEAERVFREVLEELRNQYVLGYYPSITRHDGTWHAVTVEVDAPRVELRTREGYYDD